MRLIIKISMPVLILAIALAAYAVMLKYKKEPEIEEVAEKFPSIEMITAQAKAIHLKVKTQGTVNPRTKTTLISEVTGKIIKTSPTFFTGGLFKENEIILEIDPENYHLAVASAKANLAQARLKFATEEALAAQALKDWNELGKGAPDSLVLRKPQLLGAKSRVDYASVELERALHDLEKTKIRAPYTGMIKEKNADLGQYITLGAPFATIFAIDYAEIRLPITSEDLGYLDLPNLYQNHQNLPIFPLVLLKASIASKEITWKGQITRNEGTFDPESRVLHVVAQIKDPYGISTPSSPLRIGTFVEAEINGRIVENAITLPSFVIRNMNKVLVVDDNHHLTTRAITVLKMDGDTAIITDGLKAGEKVCTTALDYVAEGMRVVPSKLDGETVQTTQSAESISEGNETGDLL